MTPVKLREHVPPPRVVEFQTVSRCNATCVVCPWPVVRATGLPYAITEHLWSRLLDDLDDLRPQRVIPYLNNEPLLDAGLEHRIYQIVTRLGAPDIEVSTNGVLLSERRSAALCDAGVTELLVSIFGHDAASQRSLMGLDYDRVCSNVEEAIRYRNASGATTRIRVILLAAPQISAEVLAAARSRWLDRGVEVEIYGYLDRAGNVPREVANGIQRDPSRNPAGCELRRHRERVYILTDGTVLFCCHDWRGQHPVGSIASARLREIWNSDLYSTMRCQVEGDIPSPAGFLCRRCKLCLEQS